MLFKCRLVEIDGAADDICDNRCPRGDIARLCLRIDENEIFDDFRREPERQSGLSK